MDGSESVPCLQEILEKYSYLKSVTLQHAYTLREIRMTSLHSNGEIFCGRTSAKLPCLVLGGAEVAAKQLWSSFGVVCAISRPESNIKLLYIVV